MVANRDAPRSILLGALGFNQFRHPLYFLCRGSRWFGTKQQRTERLVNQTVSTFTTRVNVRQLTNYPPGVASVFITQGHGHIDKREFINAGKIFHGELCDRGELRYQVGGPTRI
jgi:hypothetical protein